MHSAHNTVVATLSKRKAEELPQLDEKKIYNFPTKRKAKMSLLPLLYSTTESLADSINLEKEIEGWRDGLG